jgi:hypothetical protein
LSSGLWIGASFDLVDERYDDLHETAVASLTSAVTPTDRALAELLRGMALVFRGQIDEGVAQLWSVRTRCIKAGWTYITSASDVPLGVARVLQGDMAGGARFIEAIIRRNQELGFVVGLDMARLYLTDVYLVLLGSTQLPPFRIILRNLWFLVNTAATGWKRATAMMLAARRNPMFSDDSHWRARVEANLGFLYIMKKRHAEGRERLLRARPIAERLGSAALLARIDAALAQAPSAAAE